MRTHRVKEGYLLIDHRACGPSGSAVESATITCSHCQRVVVLNPARTRERHYCPKCDHYVCDECEIVRVSSGGTCTTFNQIVEQAQERASRGLSVVPFGKVLMAP